MRAVSLLFHDVYSADPGESGFRSRAADRYKLPIGDLDAQIAGVRGIRRDSPCVVNGWQPEAETWAADADEARQLPFLVTVDDGGESYFTLLSERFETLGWRGHCFVSTGMIGCRGFLDARQIRELDERGHVIGSHSVTHPARFSACSPAEMREEWQHSRRTLEDLLGHQVRVASVPGGYYSPRVAESAREAGLEVLFTSEPTTRWQRLDGITAIGRFTIRHGHPPNTARDLVMPTPWARSRAWISWNAKGVVKPLLGSSYSRVASWVLRYE